MGALRAHSFRPWQALFIKPVIHGFAGEHVYSLSDRASPVPATDRLSHDFVIGSGNRRNWPPLVPGHCRRHHRGGDKTNLRGSHRNQTKATRHTVATARYQRLDPQLDFCCLLRRLFPVNVPTFHPRQTFQLPGAVPLLIEQFINIRL